MTRPRFIAKRYRNDFAGLSYAVYDLSTLMLVPDGDALSFDDARELAASMNRIAAECAADGIESDAEMERRLRG